MRKGGGPPAEIPRRRGTPQKQTPMPFTAPQKSPAPRHGAAGRPRERSMIAGKLFNVKGIGPERSRRGYAAIGRF